MRQRVRSASAAVRTRTARVVRGDRPMVVALLASLLLAAVLVSGPLQSYLDGRDRVATLEAKAEALSGANAELEQRVEDLEDPVNIELLAREQQGFVRPGEVAYSLVPPEVDRPRITEPREPPAPEPDPWYARAWRALRGVLGA